MQMTVTPVVEVPRPPTRASLRRVERRHRKTVMIDNHIARHRCYEYGRSAPFRRPESDRLI
ncbi:hypothetical protein ACHWUR_28575 [Klebsiella pneumoniae]